jgi:hypothetical protein
MRRRRGRDQRTPIARFRPEPAPVSCRSAGRRECGVEDFDARSIAEPPDSRLPALLQVHAEAPRPRSTHADRPFPARTRAGFM